ncbi:hypothetical protein [Saccharomonospora cyanea]|uniref:Uncharacterized protein n=1 Tax=Saccharomonospora cyanea NA-134 TaxID=882082 RepID=H5XCB7_9PSEU|nr:hypothetical protein [Saccharomonospora cyanea]EHR59123.1 hypothetical protein SaccyDRAFT_0183 [Saccharomonospora cyanea NA-134]
MPISWDEPVKAGAVGGAVGGGAAAAMGASLNSKAVNSMASEAKEMLKAAKSGGFRVSEDAAQPIRDVLEKFQDRVDRMRADMNVLAARQPTLGNHDYGQKVALHHQEAVTVRAGSPVKVLEQLTQVLADADQALKIAMEKYKEAEGDASNPFKSGQV